MFLLSTLDQIHISSFLFSVCGNVLAGKMDFQIALVENKVRFY